MLAELASRMVTVTVARGANAQRWEHRSMPLADLLARLRTHEVASKEQSECVVPGRIDPCPTPCRQAGRAHSVDCGGGAVHRLAANVRTVEALFLDFDTWDETALAAALERVRASGYVFMCYSSPSYAPPLKAKVRIVFPLAAAHTVADVRHWRDVSWPALVRAVGLPDADRACSDVSRLYYLPSKPSAEAATFTTEGGSRLLEVPTVSVVRVASRPASELVAHLRAEVDYPPDVELVERLSDGAPLATEQGGRHPAILRVTWLLASLNPRPTAESVETLLAPSCAAMGDDRDFLAEAVRCFETADPDTDSPEAVDYRARRAEQEGTDNAFARRLVREASGPARFVPEIGWMLWERGAFRTRGDRPLDLVAALRPGYEADLLELKARILEIDEQLKASAPGSDHVRRLAEKRNALNEKAEKFYATCIRPTQEASRASSVLRVAEDLDAFRAAADSFDPNPADLVSDPTVVSLNSSGYTTAPNSPTAMNTLITHARYDADARCPLFEQVLSEVLPDPEVRGFFQRAVGYSFTGHTSEQIGLFVLLGEGGNGKSTLLNAITHALGTYAGMAPKTLLVSGRSAPNSWELAALRGLRLVHVMELNDREYLDSDRLKSIVGGDQITAARKYEHPITFRPQCKLWMPCNRLPRVTDADNGAWRRIAIIEFPTSFIAEPDLTLPERLRAEADGILAWGIRGMVEWRQRGLTVPESCRRLLTEYRVTENDVLQFAHWHRAERGETGTCSGMVLYDAYKQWCEREQIRPRSNKHFAGLLAKCGFKRQHTKHGTSWTWTPASGPAVTAQPRRQRTP